MNKNIPTPDEALTPQNLIVSHSALLGKPTTACERAKWRYRRNPNNVVALEHLEHCQKCRIELGVNI